MFESTCSGSCLVTDYGSIIGELFEVDKTVITYSSIDECVEKYKYLITIIIF